MKYFKKKNRIYTSILLSMSILFSSHAFPSDLVPNEEINGSNGKLFTGLIYALRGFSSGKYLDGRNGETQAIMTNRNPQGDKPLLWSIQNSGEHSALRGVSSRKYLDGRNGETEAFMTNRNPQGDKPLLWNIQQLDEHYALQGVSSHKYLDGRNGETPAIMTNRNPQGDKPLLWDFIPQNYRLSAVIQNFDYKGDDLNALLNQAGENFSQIVIERETIQNKQNQGEIDIQKTRSKETTYSFSWSFNSSEATRLSQNLSVQVNYTPPFGIGGIGGSVGYGLGHESEKSFSASTVHSKNVSTTESTTVSYRVASRTRLTTTRRQTHNTLDIPFSARCTFSALADRARKNGTIASMVPVDNQSIRALLKHEGLLSENQHLQEDNTIIIRGILRAGYSLSETIFGEEPLDVVMP